jgi:formate--tetrahydrofolate ligase
MRTDLQIEQSVEKLHIRDIAARLGLGEDDILLHGRHIAKIPLDTLEARARAPDGKLVLVTAMSPTPGGLGKTTTTIGLGDAINRLGKLGVIAIREPSLGPYFGIKGGGTGAGLAQVTPAEDVNMHFTGDLAAAAKAANLLAAIIDNHVFHSNALGLDPRRITWKRVVDLNDRALREIIIGLGGPEHGVPRKDGFLITPACEMMAILCLCSSFADLRSRVRRIIFGYTADRKPVTCDRLKADAAMVVLLRDAVHPNLVQSLEHTPALVHGSPFANIAHGCSSALATRLGLKLGDYLVTEAGFGADLGAEKFFDIKCRIAKLKPAAAVIVATLDAIEYHGGHRRGGGWDNLRRHVAIIRRFGVEPVVALNRFPKDRPADLRRLVRDCEKVGVRCEVSEVYRRGGAGGKALAQAVLEVAKEANGRKFRPLYPLGWHLRRKIEEVATQIYGARHVYYSREAARTLDTIEELGFGNLPVCMAKTQMSFTDNPKVRGAPEGFDITINEVTLSAGAGFVVAVAGQIVTMPGLPRVPAAERVKVDARGNLLGMV